MQPSKRTHSLQGAFGAKLKGVQQLDAANLSADVATIDAHLDVLRPAIASYGAKVEVRHNICNMTSMAALTGRAQQGSYGN